MSKLLLTAALVAGSATAAVADPIATFTYETGPAYVAQNDGRYGVNGTRFSADDVGQQDNLARAERATAELAFGRHRVIALYAPFELATRITVAEPFTFRSTTFPTGAVVDHNYRFNGYRASYLYEAVRGTVTLAVGASVQIRDADVAFSSADGALRDDQSDIGFVPALKARVTYAPRPDCAWAMLDADGSSTFGLAGDTSGGLYDVGLSAGYPFRHDLDLYATLRVVGGGAAVPDQDFVNWANFASAALGVRVSL